MKRISSRPFGTLDDGREVTLIRLENSVGANIEIMNLGATIVTLHVPDRHGVKGDVTLGFDNPQQYLDESPYFGAIVGRYANRIAGGEFNLNGLDYKLAANNGPNHLHGGVIGFDKQVWKPEMFVGEGSAGVKMSLTSVDGDEGYPGEVSVEVTYTLDDDNKLTVEYLATTTEPTVINLSQHAYFNLAGHDSGSIADHQLFINADAYTPVDSTLIPTGEISSVAETPMDFRVAKAIGRDINESFQQLNYGRGFDHNWVLNSGSDSVELPFAASVYDPVSGRSLRIYTDQPGVQFYAGNFLDGSITGKQNAVYEHRQGFCLETQHFPDSPNQPTFPSTILRRGESYQTTTIFEFGVE